MAVLPMAKINVYGLKRSRKKILEALQLLGVIEVRDFTAETEDFEKSDTSAAQSRFNKARADAQRALGVLEEYSPEKKSVFSSLEGKTELSGKKYDELVGKRDEILASAANVLRLEKSISDLRAEIVRMQTAIETLSPWRGLGVPMNFRGTEKTAAFIGTFPDAHTEEELLSELAAVCGERGIDGLSDSVHIEVISQTDMQTCVFVLCGKEEAVRCEEVLRYMGFAAPASVGGEIPHERIGELERGIEGARAKIKENEEEIVKCADMRGKFKFMVDYYAMRADKYKVISQLAQSANTFALTGYIPLRDAEKTAEILEEKYGAAAEFERASAEEAPVALQNNGFSAPLEGVLETYSLPGPGEIDPTTVMSLFYYFLFGIMLSDAAYGLIMVIGCALALWKFPRMDGGMKKTLKMFLYCGISTTFWGAMFGGFFGDAIQVVSSTFFGHEIEVNPLWFSPINEPMRMLMFSFAVGIVHLFAGLGVKMYMLVKDGKYLDAIYDTVFWYLLVGGGIVYLLSMQMFVDMSGLGFKLPQLAGKIATVCAAIGAVGIALTAGRSSSNPFKRLAKGLYELYNVTGYLSDILSYSRLLALGLATGVIANVFNKMGGMLGGGVVGAIGFTIIFIAGHTLNIGINLLGAYVHTNRLQFVEFFGKFYEGGGRKFSPFRAETRYFEPESK